MTSKHLATSLVLLLLVPFARAQSRSPAEAARENEVKRARIEREQKALAMVEGIVRDVQALKLPENRIRIQIALADLLWERDEQLARSLFNAAAASLREITVAVTAEDSEYQSLGQLPLQMRRTMLEAVAKHDAQLALDFLRATRPADAQSDAQSNIEAQLEMALASEIAGKDPTEALRVAEESLKKGIDYQVISLLYRLHTPDKTLSEKLLASILGRLREEDFSKNPQSCYVALTLLRTWSENKRAPQQGLQRTTLDIRLTNLNEQAAKELSARIIETVTNGGLSGSPHLHAFSSQHSGTLEQLKVLMPDLEKLVPNEAVALRKKIAEFERFMELQQGPSQKYQELIQNGTPNDLLEASKTASPDIAEHLIHQAASKFLEQGDADGARQIASKIVNPRERKERLLGIDRHLLHHAAQRGSFSEARALISRIPAIEERAGLLAQWASMAAEKGDRSTAIELLGAALALLGERSRNYQQIRVQLQIARAYEELDLGKSVSIVESTIDQFNELAGAALILDGFDLQYFRENEFIIIGGNMMNIAAQEIAGHLESIALRDFERARTAALRFQRAEIRAMALLQIVLGTLPEDGAEDTEGR